MDGINSTNSGKHDHIKDFSLLNFFKNYLKQKYILCCRAHNTYRDKVYNKQQHKE